MVLHQAFRARLLLLIIIIIIMMIIIIMIIITIIITRTKKWHRQQSTRLRSKSARTFAAERGIGKRDSVHHHLLEVISETANVLESRQKLLYIWVVVVVVVVVVYRIGLPRYHLMDLRGQDGEGLRLHERVAPDLQVLLAPVHTQRVA